VILVVSSPNDEHGQVVLREMAHRGGIGRLIDLARFPQELRLSLHFDIAGRREFTLKSSQGDPLALSDVRVVWWRRPQPFQIHPGIQRPSHRGFAYGESMEAFAGLWQTLDVFWVNHPTRDEVAARKVYQLRVAQEVGLQIPITLVSNDPDEVRAFVAARGSDPTIYKAFSATEQEWRETRLLRPEELAGLDNVAYAPVIFQEYVSAGVDLRITIVGQAIFAAAIHSQDTSYPVDFRMDMASARVEATELPPDVSERLHALMAHLGLVYGAIDMRRTPDGRYVFLEVNPAGQWLFIEQRTGQPISTTLASLLVSRDR
jgi:hypothetical protein